jgi:hypothetical protein
MELYHVFVLAGLVAEIIGGFILALDAIGLERIARWVASLRRTREEMAGEQVRKRSTFTDPNRFIAGIGAASGGAAGYLVSERLPVWVAHLPRIVSLIGIIMVAGVFASIIGVALYQSALFLLHHITNSLWRLEQRARIRTNGLLGFGLLFIGFLLQFVGTLGDMLRK